MRKLFITLACLGAAAASFISFGSLSADLSKMPGRVDTIRVNTTLMVSPYTFNIALPAQYIASGDTTSYPVIYLLNGHGGNQNSWGGLIPLDSVASAYSVIIVTPDGRNTWYWDSPVASDRQMESFMINELIPYVDANYRTIPARESRAITGLSMGGHGAWWLALRHHDLFANVGSTSGGVDFTPFPGRWNIPDALGQLDANREAWESHTVMSQLDTLAANPNLFNIIMDCGTEDFFYKVNNTLDSTLTAMNVPHVYLTSPGVHNGEYWKRSIYPQLDFFARHLRR